MNGYGLPPQAAAAASHQRPRPVATMERTTMTEFGFSISSEEFGPLEMVEIARQAEQAGFGYVLVSDHFHPWVSAQGESPFIWSVIGGIAAATNRIGLGTA